MQCIFTNFHKKSFQNFRRFSQKFPANCVVFRPNEQKLNAGFAKFVEICAKLMHFSQFPWERFWSLSKVFSRFQINSLCGPNTQNINAVFVKFFEIYAKIMQDSCFLEKNVDNFRKFSQIFPGNSVLHPTAKIVNAGFV